MQFDVTLNQSTAITPLFGLVSGGPAGAIASVAGGGANYVVTVSGVYGAGSLGLAVGAPGNYEPLAVQTDQAYTIQATTGPAAIAANGQTLQQIDPDLYNAVLAAWNADGGISRNDMIDILQSADIDGSVSNQALAGLQVLTQPGAASLLNEPDDVAVLAADVVQGNQANADYQGQPLGNLASQPTAEAMAACLTDLVQKWFEGSDVPAAAAPYTATAGSLYGTAGGPSSADMRQGAVGDCYFIAAMGSIADTDPQAIESMFIDNGDGTYTVRFYAQNAVGTYVPDYVTVNSTLPANGDGSLLYAGVGADGAYWLPLLEKAYAQWNQTGQEGRDGSNTYAALSGGYMFTVDQQVLGCAATTINPAAGNLAAEQTVIADLQAGEAVTAAIFADSNAALFNQLSLVNQHGYEVAGYDPASQTFLPKNPWGCDRAVAVDLGRVVRVQSLDGGGGHAGHALGNGALAGAAASASSAIPAGQSPGSALGVSATAHAAALSAALGRPSTPDAAAMAILAYQGAWDAQDSTPASHIDALDSVLADYGRNAS